MLNVLHCIYDDPHNPWVAGGGAVRVLEIYRRLTDDVSVKVVSGNYPGARDETVDGIQYMRIGARSPYAWSRWSYAREATRLLRRDSYDVGIFDFSVYTPIRVPRNRRVGVAVHHLTGPSAPARWGRPMGAAVELAERRLLRPGLWFSAPSEATLAQLRSIVRADAKLLRVGNGVGEELFRVERQEQPYLLFFGRLDLFHKGLDVLLRAMAQLVPERPDLELIVAGRGRDAQAVASLAERLGIAANIHIMGDVSDAERLSLFAGARLLLMPSRFEGFGLVAAEAMAAGLPVVAAAAGALPEVVGASGGAVGSSSGAAHAPRAAGSVPPDTRVSEPAAARARPIRPTAASNAEGSSPGGVSDGATARRHHPVGGVLVRPDDPGALARAVAELLDDPDRRAALSRSARERARRFSWDTVARDHLCFLRCIHAGERHESFCQAET